MTGLSKTISLRKTMQILSRGDISEHEALLYFSTGTLLTLTYSQYAVWIGYRSGTALLAECALTALVTILGIGFWWRKNGGATGRSFLTRALLISVPLGLVVFLVQVALGFAMYFVVSTIIMAPSHNMDVAYSVGGYSISYGLYIAYWLIGGGRLAKLRALDA